MQQKLKIYLLNAIITYYIINSETIKNLEKQNSELAESFIEAIDIELREELENLINDNNIDYSDDQTLNYSKFSEFLNTTENLLLEYCKNILNKKLK